jgi:D-alanine-D-alanine ligase
MKAAVLANLKQNAPTWPDMPPDQWDDLDSWETVEAITLALEKGGHRVTFLEGDETLYNNLQAVKPDICFNLCEGHFGDSREAQVPAILELLQIPCTGSRVLTLALALDKPMTKRILAYHGLPTPAFQVFERADEPLDPSLQFPLFVKPSRAGTGTGVKAQSIVRTDAQLRRQLRYIFERYSQPVLVEHFVEGREVTVGIVGNLKTPVARRIPEDQETARVFKGLHFFPPLEVDLAAYPAGEAGVYTNRIKMDLAHEFHYLCPAPLKESQIETLNWLAAATFRVLGCLDVARVAFRLDANDYDKPYILEVNPLPGLDPDYSDLCIEATAAGWRYEELINRILDEAIQRHQLKVPHSSTLVRPEFPLLMPV